MISPELAPTAFQLRRSNGITIQSVLEKYKIATDHLHLNDNYNEIKNELIRCIAQYDVLLMSGGVSMGKFDYLPQVCEELGIEKLFRKIKQRPGKPFWFGKSRNQKLVFAFPGNPVSVFMCLHRYFIPWLEKSLGIPKALPCMPYLVMTSNSLSLQYFAQVKLQINEQGQLIANIVDTNGSGDFSHLAETDAFVELPLEQNIFKKEKFTKYGNIVS